MESVGECKVQVTRHVLVLKLRSLPHVLTPMADSGDHIHLVKYQQDLSV